MLKKLARGSIVALVSLLPLLVQPLPAAAQGGGAGTLFAITGINQSVLSRVDPITGTVTDLVNLAGSNQGQVGSIAGDPATHRIFGLRTSVVFIPPSTINITEEILTINDQTGTFTVSPPVNVVTGLAFDPATGTLFGLGFNALYRVDPASGATALVASLGTSCCGILATAIVPGRNTVYVGNTSEGPGGPFSHQILTVNTATGAVSASPTADGRLGFLTYDPSTNKLLTNDTSSLFSVDPASGAETAIAAYNTDPTKIFTFAGAIDPGSQTAFVHLQSLDSSFNTLDQIFSINDQSGAVTSSPVISNQLWSLYFETPAPTITPDSIEQDVQSALASGAISNAGVANSLLAKLKAAKAARGRGQCAVAARIYQAFIHEVQAQSGKAIASATASLLVSEAQFLIKNCP